MVCTDNTLIYTRLESAFAHAHTREQAFQTAGALAQQAGFAYLSHAPVRNHPNDEHLPPLFFALGAGEQFGLVHSGFTYGALGMDVYRFD